MRILLIHTGGTIGMAATESGFAPKAGVVEEAIEKLTSTGRISAQIDIQTLLPLIDSAQARPEDWTRVAQTIFDARDRFDAFVLTHGTDTLAFTSSALCMALPGIDKPVIVTGAMLPLTVEGTDGLRNLEDSISFAQTAKPGVWVQFAGRTMHGGLVRKSHSSAFDSFEAPKTPVVPRIDAEEFSLVGVTSQRIGVFSITPAACIDVLSHVIDVCDGVLLRVYGSGTAPDTPELRETLNKAHAQKVPVIAVSQCPEGGMRLGTYAAGAVLRETGVIDGRDMTPEMALVKLQYASSQFEDYATKLHYLSSCLCGEMTPPVDINVAEKVAGA